MNALKIQNFELGNSVAQKSKEKELLEESLKKKTSDLQQQESANELLKKEIQDLKLKLAESQNARTSSVAVIEEENEQIFVTMPRASRFHRNPQSSRLQGLDKVTLEQELKDAKKISDAIVGGKRDEPTEVTKILAFIEKKKLKTGSTNCFSLFLRLFHFKSKHPNSNALFRPVTTIHLKIDKPF